ncbi:MAG: type II secretion system GspH family protein [Bryobacteraceae bacterium]|nr:type II secretion system GspH family protein [Bryobacteraceae bacterium]
MPVPISSETHRRFGSRRGLTLIELIVAFTILATLTAMSVPLTKYKIRREREKELRYALREIHAAIDKYKDMADQNQLGTQKIDTDNYPEKLEVLVEGVKAQGAVDKKIRFLRRLPKDPMTGKAEWGMRSTRDDPKSNSWGGQNVFAVYSKSTEKDSSGTPYAEW